MRYRMTLIGGPNCGTAVLDNVMSWPPPEQMFIMGCPGVYRRTHWEDFAEAEFWEPKASATYEWVKA